MYTNLRRRSFRVCAAMLLVFFLVLFSIPSAFADPVDTGDGVSEPAESGDFLDDPEGAYVELNAEVPEGFRGSVSVLLMNQETNEKYTITAYRVNYYSNSLQLPYGEYSVEQVYTSENSLVYEAFVEEDSFKLKSNYTLHATVLHNAAGEAYVNGETDIDKDSSSEPDNASTTTPDVTQGSDVTQEPDNNQVADHTAQGTDNSQDQDADMTPTTDDPSAPQRENTPADDQPESKGSVVTYILKVVIGTAVFVGIVFGTVYIVRKKQGF